MKDLDSDCDCDVLMDGKKANIEYDRIVDLTERDRVVLITGGSFLIGEAVAQEFVEHHFRVAICDLNEERLGIVLKNLRKTALKYFKTDEVEYRLLSLVANFEDQRQLDTVIERTVDKFAQLDVLINQANYLGKTPELIDTNFFECFQKVLQVNLMSAARLVQTAAPHLIQSQRGVILNVSSVLDRKGDSNIAYCTMRAGISMLTKTLANELANSNLRVVALAPGSRSTMMSPEDGNVPGPDAPYQLVHYQEFARVVKFLESKKASYMHGCTIEFDPSHTNQVSLVETDHAE